MHRFEFADRLQTSALARCVKIVLELEVADLLNHVALDCVGRQKVELDARRYHGLVRQELQSLEADRIFEAQRQCLRVLTEFTRRSASAEV